MGREEVEVHLHFSSFFAPRFSLYLPFPSPCLVPYRQSAKITEHKDRDGELAIFELDEKDVVLGKEYKIVYKLRVGRGMESGDILLTFAFEGPNMSLDRQEFLEVLVK